MTSYSLPDAALACAAPGAEPPAVLVLALLPPCAGARRPDALGAGPAGPGYALPGASALLPTVAAMAGAGAPRPPPPRYAHPWLTLFRYLRRDLAGVPAYAGVAFRELAARAPPEGGPPIVRLHGLTGGPQLWEVRSPRIVRVSRRGVYEYGGEANYGQLRDFVLGGA